ALLMFITDVHALGLKDTQGLASSICDPPTWIVEWFDSSNRFEIRSFAGTRPGYANMGLDESNRLRARALVRRVAVDLQESSRQVQSRR
ncbi:MAG: hypothetical protein ACKO8U_18095, partial [Pirellula sp.]